MSCSMYNTAAAAGDSDPLLRQKPKAVRWHLFALAGRVDVCNSELSPDFLGLVSPLNWINPGRGKAFRSCSLELFHFLLWLVVHAFLSFYALIHSHSAALKLNRLFVFAAPMLIPDLQVWQLQIFCPVLSQYFIHCSRSFPWCHEGHVGLTMPALHAAYPDDAYWGGSAA